MKKSIFVFIALIFGLVAYGGNFTETTQKKHIVTSHDESVTDQHDMNVGYDAYAFDLYLYHVNEYFSGNNLSILPGSHVAVKNKQYRYVFENNNLQLNKYLLAIYKPKLIEHDKVFTKSPYSLKLLYCNKLDSIRYNSMYQA